MMLHKKQEGMYRRLSETFWPISTNPVVPSAGSVTIARRPRLFNCKSAWEPGYGQDAVGEAIWPDLSYGPEPLY
ncbi:MAG: hypothetical protein BGO21_02270 [Dyadobacter sp. 50-39]|nr:MAG: hypothetical protein BGO21_02270 [Dyadobacter sp. 50-39]